MPLAFIAGGVLLVIAGIRGQERNLGMLLARDFSGSGSFLIWVGAIGGVGAIGYIKPLQPISQAFLVLIFVVMILDNRGFASALATMIEHPPKAAPSVDMPPLFGSGGATNTSGTPTASIIQAGEGLATAFGIT
jgi:hypothetical protein